MKPTSYILIIAMLLLSVGSSFAQRAAVSTDALKWVTASPNIATDIVLNDRFTVDIEASFNPFTRLSKQLRFTHVAISPGVRYWFKRPLYSHALGVNIVGSTYDMRFKDWRCKEAMVAMGLTYSYGFILSRRCALIPAVGFGYGAFYDKSTPNSETELRPTVTKLAVSFTYIID